jgi:uncharacterized protein YukE
MPNQDRRAWDDTSASTAIDNFNRVAGQLEALIAQRDTDVANAMADYQADGVSEEYQEKERRWHTAADNVKSIIASLRSSLESSGEIAASTSTQAARAVADIG